MEGLAWRNTDCLCWQEAGFAARSPNRIDAGLLHISCLVTETICPESCFYVDKINACDTEGVASNCILVDKQKIYRKVSGDEIDFGGSWHFALGWAVSLVALPNQPSLPKPTGIIIASFPTSSIWLHRASTALRSMLHVERRREVSLSFIRLRRGLRGSHPQCIGVFSNRLG